MLRKVNLRNSCRKRKEPNDLGLFTGVKRSIEVFCVGRRTIVILSGTSFYFESDQYFYVCQPGELWLLRTTHKQ